MTTVEVGEAVTVLSSVGGSQDGFSGKIILKSCTNDRVMRRKSKSGKKTS